MTTPYGDFSDLDPTPGELRVLAEVEAELDAEEAAGLPYGDEDESGPWRDDTAAQLEAIGSTLDARHELDARRVGEDIVAEIERRPSSEQILARDLARIEGGVFTEDPYFRGDETAAAAARDPMGRYRASANCGTADDFGRCSARFHSSPDCHVLVEGAAARGSAEAAEAWRETLAGRTPYAGIDAEALGLANPGEMPGDGLDAWSDLLHNPEPGSGADVRSWILHRMGEADQPEPEPRDDLPPVTVLRAQLGI